MQSTEVSSSVVRYVKESERHLSWRINCYVCNAGTDLNSLRGRRTDSQCSKQDSEIVVVRERESRLQGEGFQVWSQYGSGNGQQ